MLPRSLSLPRRATAVVRACSAAVLACALACGIPTSIPDAPIVDVRWVVPSQSARFTVDNLLPSGVTIVVPDSSGFNIAAAPASTTRILSQDCSVCVALNGLTAPKPAFIATASANTNLPSDVVTGTVISGSVQVQVKNNYTFDPLRPNPTAGTPNGFAIITVASGSSVVGTDSINGATVPLPSGTILTRTIAISGPVTGTVPLTVSLRLNSPAGENRLIDASKAIVLTATPSGLRVANVTVNVVNRTVNSAATINLRNIDTKISDDVQSGSLLIALVNPFTVAGTLNVKLTPDAGAPITRTITLTAGSSNPPPLLFTRDEMRSLLGHTVALTYTGNVTSPTPVNVAPKQAVVITTKLDLTLTLGGK